MSPRIKATLLRFAKGLVAAVAAAVIAYLVGFVKELTLADVGGPGVLTGLLLGAEKYVHF